MNLPPLPEPTLRVECAQSFVDGWTRTDVLAYGQACAEAAQPTPLLERQRADIHAIANVATRHGWNGTDNSKILLRFIEDSLAELDALRALDEALK